MVKYNPDFLKIENSILLIPLYIILIIISRIQHKNDETDEYNRWQITISCLGVTGLVAALQEIFNNVKWKSVWII